MQHKGNVVGSNLGWQARRRRFLHILGGDYHLWNANNVAVLRQRQADLAAGNRVVLEAFDRARAAGTPWERIAWLRRSGAYRQKLPEQMMLWLACSLGQL